MDTAVSGMIKNYIKPKNLYPKRRMRIRTLIFIPTPITFLSFCCKNGNRRPLPV